jgi:hypothetical protein
MPPKRKTAPNKSNTSKASSTSKQTKTEEMIVEEDSRAIAIKRTVESDFVSGSHTNLFQS